MKYQIYKLKFDNGVHFGKRNLDDSDMSFHADTLFSALCQEALKLGGNENLNYLVRLAKDDQILFSDALPYVKEQLFLPKPYLHVERKDGRGDSSVKKKVKKMKYVQLDLLEAFINGEFPMDQALKADSVGKSQMKTSAAIRGMDETEPYRVNSFYFKEGNGLYLITASADSDIAAYVEGLLESLSYSGIGGKRSAGLGRFKLFRSPMNEELEKRIAGKGHRYMTLSLSLPEKNGLAGALDEASYQLIKRSGFVSSDTYSTEYLRKKDLYVFGAGSCFCHKFQGDIFDVSCGGTHPVYRYAKPMFLEVG